MRRWHDAPQRFARTSVQTNLFTAKLAERTSQQAPQCGLHTVESTKYPALARVSLHLSTSRCPNKALFLSSSSAFKLESRSAFMNTDQLRALAEYSAWARRCTLRNATKKHVLIHTIKMLKLISLIFLNLLWIYLVWMMRVHGELAGSSQVRRVAIDTVRHCKTL